MQDSDGSRVAVGDLDFFHLPHQAEFIRTVMEERVRHVAMIGGAGLGKTKILADASLILCSINVGCPMMLVEPTYGMVVDILEPAIREACDFQPLVEVVGGKFVVRLEENGSPVMIPRERPIPYRFRARDHAFELPWWNSEIWCRSGDKPRRLRGPTVAAAGIDEVCDNLEEVLTTLQGRVRHPLAWLRVILMTGTPRGFNWTYERFAEPGGRKRISDAKLLHATSMDNKFITRADPGWLAAQKDTYDPELYRQEVLGEFVAIGQTATYYAFSRDKNVTTGLRQHPLRPVMVFCDFNHSPLAWVIAQAGSKQRCSRCDDEKVPPGRLCGSADHAFRAIGELNGPKTTEEACAEILRRFGPPDRTKYEVYGGVRMKDRNYSDYEIIRDTLKSAPYTTKRENVVKDRTNSVNGLLRNAAGVSRLIADEDACPNLIRDLEQTRYIPNTFDIDGSNEHVTHWANALSFWAVIEHPVMAGRRG